MDIKQKIGNYFKKKSKFGIFSDFLFAAFIIALIFPQSRVELIAFINKARVAVVNPSVKDTDNTVSLSTADYNWELESTGGEINNFSDYKGKVVLLDFWGFW